MRMAPRTVRNYLPTLLILLASSLVACGHHEPPPSAARREDFGDLIVLHLYGSYYDMGRQQVELLGAVARQVYDYHRERYRTMIRWGDFGLRLTDWGASLLPMAGPLYEDSGFFDEANGMADALDVSRGDLFRAITAASFGSTVFAATRSATADGRALIGRNVDWGDANGILRPVVMHYHPNNGDLDYIMAGWPLIGAPAVGINSAGFALSFNFFVTEEIFGIPPEMRDRRALQTARTVEEGLQVFTSVRKRGMPTFMVMADAAGDIAMIECTPSACAIFRPEGDWFAQANSARTAEMIPLDRYRSPDSFARRAAMEAAVRPHVGRLTPTLAAEIIRDRSNSRWVNDPTVANLYVLNAAVIHPATKTLWHATSMQPEAPFGELVPFSAAPDLPPAAPIARDPRFGTPEIQREIAVVEEARWAVRRYADGDFSSAGAVWDNFAARGEPLLHPDRLAYVRGVVRWKEGKLDAADRLFATLDTNRAPFEVRASGAVGRAVIADQQGRRDDAIVWYRVAQSYLDGSPQYTDDYTQTLRRIAAAGLQEPQTADALADAPDLQYVPQ